MNTKSFSYFICGLSLILLLGFLIYMRGSSMIEEAVDKKHEKISSYISNLAKEKIQYTASIPEVVFVNLDNKETINKDSVKTFFQNGILESNSVNSSETPYLVLPSKPNNDDIYQLTQDQIDQIEGNSLYLASRFDEALKASKAETDRSLNKINTWVTAWLGILAFIGIFLPLIIHIRLIKDIDQAKSKADEARNIMEKKAPLIKENQQKISTNQTNLNLFEAMSRMNHLLQFPEELFRLTETETKIFFKDIFLEIEKDLRNVKNKQMSLENDNQLKLTLMKLRSSIHQATIRLQNKEIYIPLGNLGNKIDSILRNNKSDTQLEALVKAISIFNKKLKELS